MAEYTDRMIARCSEITPYDDNYLEELRCQMECFRNFGEALDTFLIEKGYTGSLDDVSSKTDFIKKRYSARGVMSPRNMSKWFSGDININKSTALQLSFVFGLGVEETEDFLRRICLSRGFDLHDMEEIVYYMAIKMKTDYKTLQMMLENLPDVDAQRIPDDDNAFYTGDIAGEVKKLSSMEKTAVYIAQNAERFAYKHVTAAKMLKRMWLKISGENGIAAAERRAFQVELPETGKSNGFDTSLSVWTIYLQMIGLYGPNVRKAAGGRNIRNILTDSGLIHAFAVHCYPDRDGLEKVLNGVRISDERMRKLLILLSFYEYLAGKAVACGGRTVSGRDAENCRLRINDILLSSGYQTLYAGNPYDWIFLFALENDDPLTTFREDFMQEIYFDSQSQR